MLIFNYQEVKIIIKKRSYYNPDICSYMSRATREHSSNLGLYRDTQYRDLASSLIISRGECHSMLFSLKDVIQAIMIALFNLANPDQNNNPLCPTDNIILSLNPANLEAYDSPEKLACDVVRKLFKVFPNIRHFDITLDMFQEDLVYLATALVDNIQQPLQFFRCEPPYEVTQSWLPKVDIRNAVCGSRYFKQMSFPKQLNKEKLESLVALNPSSSFWKSPEQTDKAIIFPSLRKLTLNYFPDYTNSTKAVSLVGHTKGALPEFPVLRYFKLHIKNRDGILFDPAAFRTRLDRDEIEFVPAVIPTRLARVVLSGSNLAIIIFGKLPVKSIGYLEVYLTERRAECTDEFYDTINRLFSNTEITHSASVILDRYMSVLDHQKIYWKHVDRLEVSDFGLTRIVDWLEKLPNIKSLVVTYNYDPTDLDNNIIESPELNRLQNCRLQMLTLNNATEDNIAQFVADVTMYFARSIKCLDRVYVHEIKQ